VGGCAKPDGSCSACGDAPAPSPARDSGTIDPLPTPSATPAVLPRWWALPSTCTAGASRVQRSRRHHHHRHPRLRYGGWACTIASCIAHSRTIAASLSQWWATLSTSLTQSRCCRRRRRPPTPELRYSHRCPASEMAAVLNGRPLAQSPPVPAVRQRGSRRRRVRRRSCHTHFCSRVRRGRGGRHDVRLFATPFRVPADTASVADTVVWRSEAGAVGAVGAAAFCHAGTLAGEERRCGVLIHRLLGVRWLPPLATCAAVIVGVDPAGVNLEALGQANQSQHHFDTACEFGTHSCGRRVRDPRTVQEPVRS
jgi:hypothetical protein